MPALKHRLPGRGRTLRAGVGQASREETADVTRLVKTGDGLWDLSG